MIKRPVFLVGAGRSGSTALLNVLAFHNGLAWPSNLVERRPAAVRLHRRCLQLTSGRLIGPVLRSRFRPAEAYNYWDTLFPGFRRPVRDLDASDVTPRIRDRVRTGLAKLVVADRRLLVKITGWPRIRFLKEIFPDAAFVHLVRDGRAVANSLLSVPWWWGWRGPESWRWGPLPDRYAEEWDASRKSFVVLAGIQWKILLDAVDEARRCDGVEVFDLRYEDLCDDPMRAVGLLCDHCEFDPSRELEEAVARWKFRSANAKWRHDLSEEQQRLLESCVSSHLERFGYERCVC